MSINEANLYEWPRNAQSSHTSIHHGWNRRKVYVRVRKTTFPYRLKATINPLENKSFTKILHQILLSTPLYMRASRIQQWSECQRISSRRTWPLLLRRDLARYERRIVITGFYDLTFNNLSLVSGDKDEMLERRLSNMHFMTWTRIDRISPTANRNRLRLKPIVFIQRPDRLFTPDRLLSLFLVCQTAALTRRHQQVIGRLFVVHAIPSIAGIPAKPMCLPIVRFQ